jgi:hypothetical protein
LDSLTVGVVPCDCCFIASVISSSVVCVHASR